MTRQEILAVAKPILFNTEMVKAILDGRKSMTRRVIKPQPEASQDGMWHWKDCQWMDRGLGFPISSIQDYAPFQPGDYLYVRETWTKLPVTPGEHFRPNGVYYYKADEELRPERFVCNGWRPSIHMPKEAARLFLRVTGVRVERLQEINWNGMEKEGIITGITHFKSPINNFGNADRFQEAVKEFSGLWDSTIKPADLPLYGWDANPWVWVIEFERMETR